MKDAEVVLRGGAFNWQAKGRCWFLFVKGRDRVRLDPKEVQLRTSVVSTFSLSFLPFQAHDREVHPFPLSMPLDCRKCNNSSVDPTQESEQVIVLISEAEGFAGMCEQ